MNKKTYISPLCMTEEIEMGQYMVNNMSRTINQNEIDNLWGEDAKQRELDDVDYGNLW